MKHQLTALVVAERARLPSFAACVRSVYSFERLTQAVDAESAVEELDRRSIDVVFVSTADADALRPTLESLVRAAPSSPRIVHWESGERPRSLPDGLVSAWSVASALEGELLAQALEAVLHARRARAFVRFMEGQVAHDLRSLLGVISMGAQLQLEARSLDEVRSFVGRVRNATRRLQGLVGDVVELSRARLAPGERAELERTDLALAFAERLEEIRIDQGRRSFELSSSGDFEGRWDVPRSVRLFGALIDTVLRGSTTRSLVHIALDGASPRAITLSVLAEEASFDERVLEVSTTRFDELELLGAEESSGVPLGLYLVRSLTDELGGCLSPALEGVELGFHLELPRSS